MNQMRTSVRCAGRAVVVVVAGLLVVSAVAVAAPRLNGHVYEGTMHRGPQGKVAFQVSRDGKVMRFIGRTAFTTTCWHGGRSIGRVEVVVVQRKHKGDASSTTAPLVKIRPDGAFYGSGSQILRRGKAPAGILRYHFAGRFTRSGDTAVGRFFVNHCSERE
jgi:hypothetical protein